MVDRLGSSDVEGEEGSSTDWGGVDTLSSFTRFSHFFFSHFFNNSIATVKVVATAHAKNPIKNQLKYNY